MDIVIAMSSGSASVVGKSAQVLNGVNASFGAFCGVLRPNVSIEARYLGHFLKSDAYRSAISDLARGVNINNLKWSHFEEIGIPLAPRPEQKRIADKLDTLLARITACRDRLDRLPAILKQFRQSVLAAATSGRLTEDWRNIQHNSSKWKRQALRDLCSRVSVGHVGETSKHYTSSTDGVPFIRSQNVRPGRISLDGLNYITNDFHQKLKKSQLRAGDLLVVRVGANRGDSCILPDGFTDVNCANIVFARPDVKVIVPEYLGIFFQSPTCQEDMLGKTVGGAQGVINTGVVELIEVDVPPESEQVEIVQRVKALFALANRLEARVSAARAKVATLTPASLAKAFRGELVPQDPDDEPASALLERIRAERATSTDARPRTRRRASA